MRPIVSPVMLSDRQDRFALVFSNTVSFIHPVLRGDQHVVKDLYKVKLNRWESRRLRISTGHFKASSNRSDSVTSPFKS